MKLNVLDKSLYFKGLMLLLKKDSKISEPERQIMLQACRTLGFEEKFCEKAMDSLLDNEYVIDEPPMFSTVQVAKSYLKDGIKLALCDKSLDPKEKAFLMEVALKNNISPEWLNDEIYKYNKDFPFRNMMTHLEAANFAT